MTAFTIIGLSVCVIFVTMLAGAIMALITTLGKVDDTAFYACVFFWSWIVSTTGLILLLIEK